MNKYIYNEKNRLWLNCRGTMLSPAAMSSTIKSRSRAGFCRRSCR